MNQKHHGRVVIKRYKLKRKPMIVETVNALPQIDPIADQLRVARTESAATEDATVPFTREKGMQLESGVTLQLQRAATTLESTRAALWHLIDDSRPLPDETLQSAIQYWAAVRRLSMWLGRYRELRSAPIPPFRPAE